MTLRPWGEVPYLPILGMRPAEMRALEELPGQTKDALLPLIPLRPWVGSNFLQSSLERIVKSYGRRPVLVSVGEREPVKDRPVFGELEALRDPRNGFANWCEFVRQNELFVPVAQLGVDPQQEIIQIANLHALGRGMAIVLGRPAFGSLGPIASVVSNATNGGDGVCIILDYGVAGRDHLEVAATALGYINVLRQNCAGCVISVSASSFPSSFADRPNQQIYERMLFNEVARFAPGTLIYSDRGSARAEQLSGGSGVIPARIDYPLFDEWKFYRSEDAGFPGYIQQAAALMRDPIWNGGMRVWGTQMIERTARGDRSAIDTPGKATAARINLHLQLQSFYNEPGEVEDTEEDWDG